VRAALAQAWGGPDCVAVVDVAEPVVQPGQVLVGVEAAALNYPDLLLVANRYQISVEAPFVVGSEFAGRVIEVSDDVVQFRPGDRVAGATMVGAFAERVVVGADQLDPVPDGLDWASAAGFGVAYRTAYHALVSFGRIRAGSNVIVLGAGGGVGAASVDLAVLMGARVIAVTSTADRADFLRDRGAHVIVDRTEPELARRLKQAAPGGAALVVDPVGGSAAEAALRALEWGGEFVVVGFASGEIPRIPLNLPLIKGARISGFELRTLAQHRPDLVAAADRALSELVRRGLRPAIGAVHDLDHVATALEELQRGEAIGKTIIRIGEEGRALR
jgi:NADPH:quinone reductase